MGTLIVARIKVAGGREPYRKVLAEDNNIFDVPIKLSESIKYSSGAILESDEWFYVDNFSGKSYCPHFLKTESFSSVNFDTLTIADFEKIEFICGVQGDFYFFQRITPSSRIQRKYIAIGDSCKYVEDERSINLRMPSDGIYCKISDKLYFHMLKNVVAIFKGIDELYKEATIKDVQEFLANDFIQVGEGFHPSSVGTSNRQRITKAIEIIKGFSEEDKKFIVKYINDYCSELHKNESGNFIINKDGDLKTLLWGIEQRYFTTDIGAERRVANSFLLLQSTASQKKL